MDAQQLTDEEIEAAFEAPAFLLFKHSPICPVSDRAFGQYRRFLAERDDVPTGWIDVIAQRPTSQDVARRTGVRHESPQALLLRGGRVTDSASHGGITAAWLDDAWER